MTPQRLAILQALHEGGHLTPTQVYQRVRRTGMTEATVYRTLEFLAKNDLLLVADHGNGHLAYELSKNDHYHLICRNCGAQMELEPALFNLAIHRMERTSGYRINVGHLTFYGLCPKCQVSSQ
jgi:Fur family ferric uptake transcriptional regulator